MNVEGIEILYEDNVIVVVNKPSGLPTQSTVDKKRPNLYDLLRNSKKFSYLGLHHRLDVPTSGVLLLTKSKEVNKAVAELFSGRDIEKTYLCLTHQIPSEKEFKIQNYLKAQKLGSGKTKMKSVKAGGDPAETHFTVRQVLENKALVEARPQTGRMHQIRVHLAEAGYPILGDALYFRVDRKYPRLMLHAWKLKFKHPQTGQELEIEAPLPEDFGKLIKTL